MTAIRYLALRELRRKWRATVALALLAALLGGVTLAFAAGARRTASAYPRMRAEVAASDLLISPGGPVTGTQGFYAEVAKLPSVRAVVPFYGVNLFPKAGTSYEDVALAPSYTGFDDGAFKTAGRPKLLSGRMPQHVDEALANLAFARSTHLGVGDTVDVRLVGSEVFAGNEVAPDAGTPLRFTISGVGVFAEQVVPFSDLEAMAGLYLTPAAGAAVAVQDWAFEVAQVQADPGADLAALRADIEELAGKNPDFELFSTDLAAQAATVQRGLRPLGLSLALVAFAVGAIGLLAAGQAVARRVRIGLDDVRTLDALGITDGQRASLVLIQAATIGVLGAVGALAVAVSLSPRFPIGVARVAEPNPGVDVDVMAFLIGAPAVLFGVVLAALPTAFAARRARGERRPPTASRLSALVGRAGFSPTVVQGTRFALDPSRGPSAAPVRSSLVVATIAVAAVVASLVYAASLQGLLDTKSRYGQPWQILLDGSFAPVPVATVVEELGDDAAVAGLGIGSYAELRVGRDTVPAISFARVRGDVGLTMLEGDMADAPGEVVLGGKTARRLRVGVGDSIRGETPTGAATLRVVGRAVFPRFSLGSFQTTGLGEGAQLAGNYVPATNESGITDLPPGYDFRGRLWNFAAIRLKGGTEAVSSTDGRRVETLLNRVKLVDASVRFDQRPTEIVDYARVRAVPMLLSALLAVVALVMFVHVLVTSVRAHRRDLALLSVFGLQRRQLRATVAWQATVAAGAALIVGIPLGLAGGRTVWRSSATALHVEPSPTVPVLALLIVLFAVVLGANLVAALPGRAASRVRPAAALRSQ